MSDLPPSGPHQPPAGGEPAPDAPEDQARAEAAGQQGAAPPGEVGDDDARAPLPRLLDDPAGLVAVSVAGAVADALVEEEDGAAEGEDGADGGAGEGGADASAPAPSTQPKKAATAAREDDPRHVRCFLAVNFPLVTVRRIAEEITALKGPVAAAGLSVKWVPAPNLHLTLKFLGPVRRPVIEAIAARLGAGLRGLRPFELEARGLGAFPSLERPKVLWVGLREEPALLALQRAVEGWMGELGFAAEEREYHPHLTIGRVVGGRGEGGELAALLGERAGRAYGTGRVGEVVVYESRTLARGAEYHALARVAVGAPRIPGAS